MGRTASPSTAFSVPMAPSSTRSSLCVTGGSTWTVRWLSSSTPATMRLQQRGRLTQVAARGEQLVRVLGPQPMEVGHPLEAQEDHQQLEVYSSEAQPLAREALLPAVAEAPRDQLQVLRLPMLYR